MEAGDTDGLREADEIVEDPLTLPVHYRSRHGRINIVEQIKPVE